MNTFPYMLTTYNSLPPIIFAKGNIELLNKDLSIVGARNSSPMANAMLIDMKF